MILGLAISQLDANFLSICITFAIVLEFPLYVRLRTLFSTPRSDSILESERSMGASKYGLIILAYPLIA
jgi:hypothetical protein